MHDTTTATRPAHTPGPWSDPWPFAGTRFEIQAGGHQIAIFAKLGDAWLGATAPKLLRELMAAHGIIRNALAVMSTEQKVRWGQLNAAAGVVGDGVTRANERSAVLARASGEMA